MRRPRAPEFLLQLDAKTGRILRPKAAPIGPHTGFHRSQTLGIGVARNHASVVQIGPDRGQVFFLDAKQVDPLTAGHFHRRIVFHGRLRDGHQLFRRGHPTPHPRHHAIGSVFLDVGVVALVHQTRLRVVLVFQRPVGQQVEVHRRATGETAVG